MLAIAVFAPASLEAGTASVVDAAAKPGSQITTYDELVKAIRGARAESRERVERAVERERVREAWEIGRLIDTHILQHKERADYGTGLLKRLAIDLEMSRTELSYMLQFARAYPVFPSTEALSWGDYRELLALNDAEQRNALALEASKKQWSQKEIREAVRRVKAKLGGGASDVEESAPETLTPLEMGQAGTYRVILAKTGPFAGELALDLGFSNYYRISALVGNDVSDFRTGDIVSFEGDAYRILEAASKKGDFSRLYTYKAWVNRVLDGDTIETVVDLGFGITTVQTLRLRGIDAPEVRSSSGREAKEFVEGILPSGTQVFIKTTRSDKYDRYLVDIFVTDADSGEDKFLNGVLLEKGFAVRVGER